jgi:hypothetical protein
VLSSFSASTSEMGRLDAAKARQPGDGKYEHGSCRSARTREARGLHQSARMTVFESASLICGCRTSGPNVEGGAVSLSVVARTLSPCRISGAVLTIIKAARIGAAYSSQFLMCTARPGWNEGMSLVSTGPLAYDLHCAVGDRRCGATCGPWPARRPLFESAALNRLPIARRRYEARTFSRSPRSGAGAR